MGAGLIDWLKALQQEQAEQETHGHVSLSQVQRCANIGAAKNLFDAFLNSSAKKSKKVESSSEQLEIPLTESQKQYQEIDYRTRVATAEAKEREAELKRIQLEKLAGNLMPIELVERIFTINIQNIFKNIEGELENLASIYIPNDREALSLAIQRQKELLVKIVEKSKEDAGIEIENAVNEYAETRSRGERK